MAEKYSYSRLETYSKCAKQYKLNYIDRIKPPRVNVESFMGNRVHESLEFLYKDFNYLIIPTVDDVINYYIEKWNKYYSDNVVVNNKKNNLEHYYTLGQKLIYNFYHSHQKTFGEGMVVAIEKKVEFYLDNDQRYLFTGKIDRVHQSPDGNLELHDYKTGKTIYDQKKADNDKQLAFYQIGINREYGFDRESVKLYWHFLVPDTILCSTRKKEQLDDLVVETIEKIKMIEASNQFPATCSFLCNWCPYKEMCQEFSYSKFNNDKNNKFVKTYTKTKSKKEKLMEEHDSLIEQYENVVDDYKRIVGTGKLVKKTIIKHANKIGKDTLEGNIGKLKLKEIENLKVKDQEHLIELLKKNGIYEQVIEISIDKLQALINRMDVFTADEYMKFLESEKDYKIEIIREEKEEKKSPKTIDKWD